MMRNRGVERVGKTVFKKPSQFFIGDCFFMRSMVASTESLVNLRLFRSGRLLLNVSENLKLLIPSANPVKANEVVLRTSRRDGIARVEIGKMLIESVKTQNKVFSIHDNTL